MFYLVGIGLGNCKNITVEGLEIVTNADLVYLEAYTSILSVGKHVLEEFYGKEIHVADRLMVEQQSHDILTEARDKDVVMLVVGDPFSATTHTDLILRAKELGVPTRVVHNASIMTAVGSCGLQLYNFGETVSIPFWLDSWRPDSFYDKICRNNERGLHTLCLLDIKVNEPTLESLVKKKKEFLPPSFMTVAQAARQLIEIIEAKTQNGETPETPVVTGETKAVGLARVGSKDEKIIWCSLRDMVEVDLGPPLHSLVIVGKTHPLEEDFLKCFALS